MKLTLQLLTGVVWAAVIILFALLVSVYLTEILIEPLRAAGLVQ